MPEKKVKKAVVKEVSPEKKEQLYKAGRQKLSMNMNERRMLAREFVKRAEKLLREVNRGVNNDYVDKYLDLLKKEKEGK